MMLGETIKEDADRDAIHIAILPVICGENWLIPGTWIKLKDGEAYRCDKSDMIVDPFLTRSVVKGEKFYACLRPGIVTEMKHVWKSPVVDTPQRIPMDTKIIHDIAARCRVSYEELIEVAKRKVINGLYAMDNRETYKDVSDAEWKEFWKVFEEVTGLDASDENWAPFSCSC